MDCGGTEIIPFAEKQTPKLASQRRVAFASMASKTGSNSPGDELMTRSTSAVAVCCSSDSVSSRVRCCSASNSRTFSMAITAWSAKVVTSSICLSVNGLISFRRIIRTPIASSFRMSGTASIVRWPKLCAILLPVGNSSADACRS